MKNNWQTKKLGEVCIIKPPKNEARLKLEDDDSVSFAPMEDLGVLSKNFQLDKERKLKEVSGSYTYFADGDVLLAKITPCFENGKLGIARNLRNGVGFGSSEYIVFRPTEKIIPDYLFYFLCTDNFREKGKKRMSGAVGHKRVSREFIENYLIPYPESTGEQKRIVKILDEVFEKIEKAKENTEKNLRNSQELFESYARIRFENPGTWDEKELGEVCDLYQGLAINTKTKHLLVEKSDLPLLRIKDLKNNTVEQYVNNKGYPKNALVNESDLIYTRTGQIGLVFTGKKGVLHNNSFKIEPKNGLSKEYLFWWLQNLSFKTKIITLASRAAQPDITHTLFKQQLISIPSPFEQNAIVKKLNKLSAETKKLEAIYKQKLVDLEELKKSILQKAFAGTL